ncbi:RagB/SusD family nutrient uptake outer membrane protein [uncultured Parabacteroides sp.]|uniref:RagB/SusD family nutrient uptake outer membrane protein n=1 Tax=uncultured Parabacteroides sp. TaxID=512312 RepID=UPI00260111B6|nr:RagB/SusD family nutrient uptake outer membrane protein [uncultured Parabacteroides sp.]
MKRFILTAVSCMTLLCSCENFIDLQPMDKITMDDYWSTSTELEYYTRQFYPSFCPWTQMVAEMATDNDDMITGSPSVIMDGVRSKTTGNWTGEWTSIRNVNIFFEHYTKCKSGYDAYKQYLGEAYFFRAWFYFNLLKKYGDVPWYSHVIEMDDTEALMRPRDSRLLIADSILADLDNAITHLELRKDVGNNRINKEAALAFKTRVALFEGSWQKYHANTDFGTAGADPAKYFRICVEAAEELMKGDYKVGIYSTRNPDEDYYKLFGFDNMSDINEVLLYRAFNAAEGAGNSTQGFITYNSNSKGITWELVSSYLDKNGKPYDYLNTAASNKGNAFLTKIAEDCDVRLKSTVWIPDDLMSVGENAYFNGPTVEGGALQLCPTGFQVKKTANPSSPAAGKSWETQAETGLILLRYGEVLLNYAEAKCELDNSVAYEALNLLRQRAGMPDFTVNAQSLDKNKMDYGYSITDELYEIRRERRVEMALEGQRDEDYMRWAASALFKNKRPKGYPADLAQNPNLSSKVDENGLIDYYKGVMPDGYQFRDKQDYLYSIPQDELTLNPNLKQNPGWN